MGKAVGRLNKQKLAELDDSVRAVYGRDRASLRMWERVREEAASASPILENLTNLFKMEKGQALVFQGRGGWKRGCAWPWKE